MFSISFTTVVIMQDCRSIPDRISRLVCIRLGRVVSAGMVFVYAFIGMQFFTQKLCFLFNKQAVGWFRGGLLALFFLYLCVLHFLIVV